MKDEIFQNVCWCEWLVMVLMLTMITVSSILHIDVNTRFNYPIKTLIVGERCVDLVD